jgi:restriction endonuclease S subunit
MMNHTYVTLGEVADINPKPNWNAVNQCTNISFVPMASVSDIDYCLTNEEERPLDDVRKGYTYFQRGDILLAKITPCFENGKVAIANISNDHGFGSTEFHVIRARPGVTHSRFLYYLLRQPSFITQGIKNMTGSAGQKRVPKHFLEEFRFALPSMDVQIHIADTLDKADALRRKDQELLRKYDDLAQSIFYEMFGDPVRNEKGWDVKPLSEVTYKITDGTHATPKYVGAGVPFLRVTDLTGSNDSKKFITREEHLALIKRCNPEKGDVLYTKNGTIGVAKVVDWDYEFSIFVSLCLMKVNTTVLHPKFLEVFLNTPFALNQAKKHSKTGTITNLHLNEIKNILVPVPEYATQERFLSVITNIESQKRLIYGSEDLFQTKLDSYFSL